VHPTGIPADVATPPPWRLNHDPRIAEVLPDANREEPGWAVRRIATWAPGTHVVDHDWATMSKGETRLLQHTRIILGAGQPPLSSDLPPTVALLTLRQSMHICTDPVGWLPDHGGWSENIPGATSICCCQSNPLSRMTALTYYTDVRTT
jgi:hypothetical protein